MVPCSVLALYAGRSIGAVSRAGSRPAGRSSGRGGCQAARRSSVVGRVRTVGSPAGRGAVGLKVRAVRSAGFVGAESELAAREGNAQRLGAFGSVGRRRERKTKSTVANRIQVEMTGRIIWLAYGRGTLSEFRNSGDALPSARYTGQGRTMFGTINERSVTIGIDCSARTTKLVSSRRAAERD